MVVLKMNESEVIGMIRAIRFRINALEMTVYLREHSNNCPNHNPEIMILSRILNRLVADSAPMRLSGDE
jgi:uncharacterized protein YehS (DUF1456 family)